MVLTVLLVPSALDSASVILGVGVAFCRDKISDMDLEVRGSGAASPT